jgi:hypothetical protein
VTDHLVVRVDGTLLKVALRADVATPVKTRRQPRRVTRYAP